MSDRHNIQSPTSTDEPPALRFADGDLIIKLGPDRDDWLLLHQRALADNKGLLGCMLRWSQEKAQLLTNPTNGAQVSVITLSLRHADGTIVLGDLPSYRPQERSDMFAPRNFHKSELSSDWPSFRFYSTSDALGYAALAHKVFFAMIYDLPISIQTISPRLDLQSRAPESEIYYLRDAMDMISLVGAYAEYYGCLPLIATRLRNMIGQVPGIWALVAEEAADSLCLAVKLKHSTLYLDALRHLLAATPKNKYANLGELLGMSEEECEAWAKPMLSMAADRVHKLKDDLHKLQLFGTHSTWIHESTKRSITYVNMLEQFSKDSEGARAMQKSSQLARMIWGEWYALQLVGDRVWPASWCDKQRGAKAGSLVSLIQALERSANWDFPAAIIGKGVIKRYVEDFAQGNKFNPKKQLEVALNHIVAKAAELVRQNIPNEQKSIDGVVFTFRRTHFMNRLGPVTYFPLDESDLPWNEEEEWPEPPDLGLNLDAASDEWLEIISVSN